MYVCVCVFNEAAEEASWSVRTWERSSSSCGSHQSDAAACYFELSSSSCSSALALETCEAPSQNSGWPTMNLSLSSSRFHQEEEADSRCDTNDSLNWNRLADSLVPTGVHWLVLMTQSHSSEPSTWWCIYSLQTQTYLNTSESTSVSKVWKYLMWNISRVQVNV